MTSEKLPALKLYNTRTRSLDPFVPRTPPSVSLYCCGPTVYHFQHVGNMRTYIFEDLLARTLRRYGYQVRHVMNITDVGHLASDADEGEDKMLIAMRREGKRSAEIAQFYSDIFFKECAQLNITPPDVICRATDHIAEMIATIQAIVATGFGYVANGNVYFDVSRCSDYGALARLNLSSLQAGARIAVDPNKRNPHDFVLWFTKSKFENQELVWDSPWGKGYPGWHIECSAMAMRYLGDAIDIHCGGIDHIPVHHTNEIAQSEAASGKRPWVTVWMHGEHLVLNKEKMAKSGGNFVTVAEIAARGIDPIAYRWFCLSAHYRTQLNFSWEGLQNAATSFANFKRQVLDLRSQMIGDPVTADAPELAPYRKEFCDAIADDLNAPKAVAAMWKIVQARELRSEQKLALLEFFDEFLGLGLRTWAETAMEIPAEVQALLDQRANARAAKQWKESDRLRAEISAKGFTIEDSPHGVKVRRS